jgi:hypothetical protein
MVVLIHKTISSNPSGTTPRVMFPITVLFAAAVLFYTATV